MKLSITKTIGKRKYPFQFEGKNLFEVVFDSQKISFDDVKECGICKSDNLFLNARIAGEDAYKYSEVKCKDCGASVTFGQVKKEPDTFYLRKTESGALDWKPYIKKESNQQ